MCVCVCVCMKRVFEWSRFLGPLKTVAILKNTNTTVGTNRRLVRDVRPHVCVCARARACVDERRHLRGLCRQAACVRVCVCACVDERRHGSKTPNRSGILPEPMSSSKILLFSS